MSDDSERFNLINARVSTVKEMIELLKMFPEETIITSCCSEGNDCGVYYSKSGESVVIQY